MNNAIQTFLADLAAKSPSSANASGPAAPTADFAHLLKVANVDGENVQGRLADAILALGNGEVPHFSPVDQNIAATSASTKLEGKRSAQSEVSSGEPENGLKPKLRAGLQNRQDQLAHEIPVLGTSERSSSITADASLEEIAAHTQTGGLGRIDDVIDGQGEGGRSAPAAEARVDGVALPFFLSIVQNVDTKPFIGDPSLSRSAVPSIAPPTEQAYRHVALMDAQAAKLDRPDASLVVAEPSSTVPSSNDPVLDPLLGDRNKAASTVLSDARSMAEPSNMSTTARRSLALGESPFVLAQGLSMAVPAMEDHGGQSSDGRAPYEMPPPSSMSLSSPSYAPDNNGPRRHSTNDRLRAQQDKSLTETMSGGNETIPPSITKSASRIEVASEVNPQASPSPVLSLGEANVPPAVAMDLLAADIGIAGELGTEMSAIRDINADRAAAALAKPSLASAPPSTQIALQIAHLASAGGDRMSIQLNPAELGLVDIHLEFDENGDLSALITAESAETLDLLQRDSRQLERGLSDAGLRLESGGLAFSLKQDQRQDQPTRDRPGRDARPSREPAEMPDTTRTIARYGHLGGQHLYDLSA